ncbi:MAG: hypothetical protein ABW139_06510 [Candidatus Thiodiazotropha sp. DIVDIV]
MNWLKMSDAEIMNIANPIMDNLMQASTDIDHERHVRDFSAKLKNTVTKENLEAQCEKYQSEVGVFSKREFVAIYRKSTDVRVFWRQWYSKSTDEFVAFLHLVENEGKMEVVNVSVS